MAFTCVQTTYLCVLFYLVCSFKVQKHAKGCIILSLMFPENYDTRTKDNCVELFRLLELLTTHRIVDTRARTEVECCYGQSPSNSQARAVSQKVLEGIFGSISLTSGLLRNGNYSFCKTHTWASLKNGFWELEVQVIYLDEVSGCPGT